MVAYIERVGREPDIGSQRTDGGMGMATKATTATAKLAEASAAVTVLEAALGGNLSAHERSLLVQAREALLAAEDQVNAMRALLRQATEAL